MNSGRSPKSPIWRKPSDIMKIRQMKAKKRNLQKRLGFEEHHSSARLERIEIHASHSIPPAINPFKFISKKRSRSNEPEPPPIELTESVSCDTTLFQLLQASQQTVESQEINGLTDNSTPPTENESAEESPSDSLWHLHLPVDWSLKAALRLTSSQPFPWSGRLTTPEEASGVTGFVRCISLSGNVQNYSLDTSSNAQLHQCCQVWFHPSLPWLNLFPRQGRRMSAKSIPVDPQIHRALLTDWAESFRSLFHLLRARQCPYFYVCTHNFTVLFRAAGIGSNHRVHAMLTPTSRGFRAALSAEGIEFTMPLANENMKMEDSSLELSSDELGNGSQTEDDDEDEMFSWLKSVGVEGAMLNHLDRLRQRVKKKETLDYRPQSLVYVEDGSVHALFNYLINCKSCIPNVGPLMGIPPTLLSPVAFTGATLRSLQVRQRQAQQDSVTMYVLDMSGPILPHVLHYLKSLLSMRAPDSHFKIMFSTLDGTVPFSDYRCSNTKEAPSVFGQQSLSDCGLLREVLEEMCSQPQGTVLHEVQIQHGKYCWS